MSDLSKWQRDITDHNFDYLFKILIIGESSVGKTSLLFRYADDSFTSAFVSTVGIDFKVKTLIHDDKRVKLQIWVSSIFHGKLLHDRKNTVYTVHWSAQREREREEKKGVDC